MRRVLTFSCFLSHIGVCVSSPRIFPLQSALLPLPTQLILLPHLRLPGWPSLPIRVVTLVTTGSSILNPLLALSASVLHYQSSLLDPLLSVSAVDPENSALCRSALPAAVRSVKQLQVPRSL